MTGLYLLAKSYLSHNSGVKTFLSYTIGPVNMGPKKNTHADPPPSPTSPTLEKKLEDFIASFNSRFDKLERLLAATTEENKVLRATLADRDKELYSLKERLNEQEQYGRGWSIRVLNVKLTEEESTSPLQTMRRVYNQALLPILEGALDTGIIGDIPICEELLETAHILPAKQGKTPPIICRFYSRNMRALIFKLKKEYAPRRPESTPGGHHQQRGKFEFPIYEDLTRPNFRKFQAISKMDNVESVWTINGSIRYRLKDSTAVHKVTNIFEPFAPPTAGDRTGPRGDGAASSLHAAAS